MQASRGSLTAANMWEHCRLLVNIILLGSGSRVRSTEPGVKPRPTTWAAALTGLRNNFCVFHLKRLFSLLIVSRKELDWFPSNGLTKGHVRQNLGVAYCSNDDINRNCIPTSKCKMNRPSERLWKKNRPKHRLLIVFEWVPCNLTNPAIEPDHPPTGLLFWQGYEKKKSISLIGKISLQTFFDIWETYLSESPPNMIAPVRTPPI